MIHPDVWVARLEEILAKQRERTNKVEQIFSVLGDDGRCDPNEAGEIANLAFELVDDWRVVWEISAKMAAAGYLGDLKPLEVKR